MKHACVAKSVELLAIPNLVVDRQFSKLHQSARVEPETLLRNYSYLIFCESITLWSAGHKVVHQSLQSGFYVLLVGFACGLNG